MRVVIAGHGESGIGADLSGYDFVVRLKQAQKFAPGPTHAIATTTADNIYRSDSKQFWHFSDRPHGWAKAPDYKYWIDYFQKFNPDYWKPSIGCKAAMCVKEFLGVDTIYLLGFDSHFGSWHKYNTQRQGWLHDQDAERKCIESLFHVEYVTCPLRITPRSRLRLSDGRTEMTSTT